MKQTDNINGRDFREMFIAATNWLEKSVSDVDALNVFPVPDGDTGTNMLLTMHSTIEESEKKANGDVSTVCNAMSPRGSHRRPRQQRSYPLPDMVRHG